MGCIRVMPKIPLKHDVPHPELTGAALLWILSLAGGSLSIFLTVAKFRSAFRCDESLLSACGTWFECGRVLTSPWSVALGVPISTFATSYHVVLLGLTTAMLVRPARYAPIVRPLLLWLTWVGLLFVLWLFAYAALVVRGLCSYCLAIYAIQLVVFLCAWLMNPTGLLGGFVALWSNLRGRTSVLVMAALGFLAVTTAQMAIYRTGATSMKVEPRCVVQGRSLPETVLRTYAPNTPEVEVGLFVDLACPACREEFGSWLRDAAASNGRYQISVFHYAREGHCVPPNFAAANPGSLKHRSCTAAIAVECVAKFAGEREKNPALVARRSAEAGLRMMGALFDLQDGKGPYFTRENLGKAATSLGFEVDVTDKDDPFNVCLDDPAMRTRILEHARFGVGQKLMETPGAFFLFYEGDVPADRMVLVKGAKVYGDVDALMDSLRQQLLGQNG